MLLLGLPVYNTSVINMKKVNIKHEKRIEHYLSKNINRASEFLSKRTNLHPDSLIQECAAGDY